MISTQQIIFCTSGSNDNQIIRECDRHFNNKTLRECDRVPRSEADRDVYNSRVL
ncbi:MAG: hypothetical protein F6K28_02505 [Microcoleus sp. SIO2G3]|nr:hypothetical protein [Microcoleus sp. SIO2G3]